MTELLVEATSLPNLHPALVHFPIALLMVAVGGDLLALVIRKQAWLERASASLYALGALGAAVAFLTGRQAADTIGRVSPDAQAAMAEHADLGLWTLVAAIVVAAVRLLVLWSDPDSSHGRWNVRRVGTLALGLGLVAVVSITADHGGALVYRHGVGVARTETSLPPVSERQAEPAGTELMRKEDGGLTWTPRGGDADSLGRILLSVDVDPPGAVVVLPAGQADPAGLQLDVSGRATLLFADTFGDVQMDARLDMSRFVGTVALVHHFRATDSYGLFQLSSSGEADLVDVRDGTHKRLGTGSIGRPPERVTLSVSSAESHLKGFVGEDMVAHGHIGTPPAGRVGLLIRGKGVLRLERIDVYPVEGH